MNAEGKFTLSAIRKLNKQVSLGEISSMRMVEIINEEMERYANHKTEQLQKEVEKLKQTIEKQRISYLTKCELANQEVERLKGLKCPACRYSPCNCKAQTQVHHAI